MVRDDTSVTRNPVPRGLVTRHQRSGPRRRAPLVRTPVTLPKVLSPGDVDRLVAVLRTERDRAMVDAMLLGGLRRCEVLGLRLEDVRSAERKVFIVDGKGGRQRLIPMSARFFTTLARYLDQERPTDASTDAVFVVLAARRVGRRCRRSGSMRSCVVLAAAPVSNRRHAISCATPVSPGCVRPACRSKRCRPRPVTPRSKRRRCICT